MINIYKIEEEILYKLENIIIKYDGFEEKIYEKDKREQKHYVAKKLK